jgi:DNA-binding PadR family transcriptional regulator
MADHDDHDRRGHRRGGSRQRARRGAVPLAIFTLLEERSMHGYEIISELDARSGGRWRPSPGSIYPALEKLEGRGLIVSAEVDGKRQFSLTDRGREVLADLRAAEPDDGAAPWEQSGTGGRSELRRLTAELAGQIRQIARFGTPDQRDEATTLLQETVRRLYEILARPRPSDDPGRGDHPD